jgi:hypothetical protein
VELHTRYEAAAAGEQRPRGGDFVTSSRYHYTLASETWVNETRTTARATTRRQP